MRRIFEYSIQGSKEIITLPNYRINVKRTPHKIFCSELLFAMYINLLYSAVEVYIVLFKYGDIQNRKEPCIRANN